MKALIVDDEPLARRELKRLMSAHPHIEVIGEAGNAAEAIRALETHAPDLVFLDIHMPQTTGFELLESLDELPQVIFTTAHDAYALQAFEVGAIDYLLKPIAPPRLAAAIGRVAERLREPARQYAPGDRPLLVREGERSWFVKLQDIELFEAVGNYAQIHFGAHRPMLLRSLQQLERRLDPAMFFRASRKHLINLTLVERFETGVGGELVAHMRSGKDIPFSRRQSVLFRKGASL